LSTEGLRVLVLRSAETSISDGCGELNNIGKERDEDNMETTNEQTPERVTVKSVKIEDEVFALDIVKRGEKRFVFEIMRQRREPHGWL
jgi:hypothetical protein